jgi:hypothetical protein
MIFFCELIINISYKIFKSTIASMAIEIEVGLHLFSSYTGGTYAFDSTSGYGWPYAAEGA